MPRRKSHSMRPGNAAPAPRTSRRTPGDKGITTLPKEGRISKASLQIAVIGELDELNAALGIAAAIAGGQMKREIEDMQRAVFKLGADICAAKGSPMMTMRDVRALERRIAELQAGLPPLKRFILPGGSPLSAALHLARAICRRAERCAVLIAEHKRVGPAVLAYLNRLSSLIFVMARAANAQAGVAEEQWPSPK